MNAKLQAISARLDTLLEGTDFTLQEQVGELTLAVPREGMLSVLKLLRDDYDLRFEQLIDVCGVDYQSMAMADGQEDVSPPYITYYQLAKISACAYAYLPKMMISPWWIRYLSYGPPPIGLSERHSICSGSFSKVIPIYAAS